MELRHLRYFVAVAECGSITKAANKLGIQQPPLGQQIRALESELQVELFERMPKRIVLSAAGEEFLQDARQILESANNAVEKIRRFDRGEQGPLIAGFTSSVSLHPIAPRVLSEFSRAYPLARIEVEEKETYELILDLQKHKLDVALMRFRPRNLLDLTSIRLLDEEMVLALPRNHKLARQKDRPATLKMIADEEFVLYRRPDGFGIYDWLIAALARHTFTPRTAHEVHRMMASINIVASGAGISLVPASMQVLHRNSIVYRPLAANILPRLPLYLVHRSNRNLSLVKNFIKIASQVRTG